MATVRLGVGNRNTILNNVKSMFDARIKVARAEALTEIQKLDGVIVDTFYPDNILQRARGSEFNKYLTWNSSFDVIFLLSNNEKVGARVAPPGGVISKRDSYGYPINSFEISGTDRDPARSALYFKLTPLFDDYQRIITERDTLITQVKDILWKASTLQQVVKVWPSVLEYCDKDTIKMFHEKVEKREKKPPVNIELDEQMKANILKAKIAHASTTDQ